MKDKSNNQSSILRKKAKNKQQNLDQKKQALQTLKTKVLQEGTQLDKKNDEITRLKRKLDTVLSLAINQKIASSSKRQQIFKDEKTKAWYQSKIDELQKIILSQRQDYKKVLNQKKSIDAKIQQIKSNFVNKQAECTLLIEQSKQLMENNKEIRKLQILLKDHDPLKQRIKILEDQLRFEKIKIKDSSSVIKKYELQKQDLIEQLRKQKPLQEQLRQKIAYWQRVNLDLSRKMQDYDRRENQYIRQSNINKRSIKKLSDEKADLKIKLLNTQTNLAQKIIEIQVKQKILEQKVQTIQNLQTQVKNQKQKVEKLIVELQSTKQYYKKQEIQNEDLKKKNYYLLQHRAQYQRALAHYQKVNDQINLTIISRIQQISKLHSVVQTLQSHTSKLQQKFQKFQILFEDRNQKGDNEIKQFFYSHIRENARLKILNKEAKTQIEQKILKFGEERDSWMRKNQIRSIQTPSDAQLFGHLYHQKNQELILLEGSNDQLLKIKSELQNRIIELQAQVQEQKKQSIALKLKASEVFRAKKQVQQARKTNTRYQQMIEQQNQNIKDYQSQLVVLRQKITTLNQRNFQLDLDNKNYAFKIKELQNIMSQINADVLIQRKNRNDKNAHLINDSLDKLQNGIKSLSFYFSCSFCGEMPSNPVTLSPCGHTYCQKQKCKEAYGEFCYQCDTGMPIESIFVNKYMKQAMGKYKFFKIVIQQTTTNVKALLKNI